MNLLDRISLAVRSTANSLIVKKPTTPEERTATLLRTAQKRLDALHEKLVQAIAREKRAEQDWRQALTLSATLSSEIDAAVKTGQTDAARGKLEQTRLAQIRTQQLEQVYHNAASFTEKMHIEIADTQAQLDQARKRYGQTARPPAQGQIAKQDDKSADTTALAPSNAQPASSSAPGDAISDAIGDAPDQARIADIIEKQKRQDG